jgi:hypothetical protein
MCACRCSSTEDLERGPRLHCRRRAFFGEIHSPKHAEGDFLLFRSAGVDAHEPFPPLAAQVCVHESFDSRRHLNVDFSGCVKYFLDGLVDVFAIFI